MSEFKFDCPQCKQNIQCDTAYAGSRINCPSCQQAIIVPPAPASAAVAPEAGVIKIKVSTLRNAAIIGLCVLCLAGVLAGAYCFFMGPRKVTFKAYVDGADIVKLRGRQLWIEHLEWQTPNKITVNGKKWNAAWDGNTSAPYAFSGSFRFGSPDKIKLTKRLGRGAVTIAEMPTPENQETLAIKVDDGPQPGADWYEFTVTW